MTKTALLAVWWVNQADCEKIDEGLIPEPYIRTEYESRLGRAGRGRLWVPEEIECRQVEVPKTIVCEGNDTHGGIVIFKKDMEKVRSLGGSTALFDAMDEALQATGTYGKQLTSQDFLVNGIVVVVTDGENNCSNISDPTQVKKTLQAVRRAENLESLLLILVGVTGDNVNLNTYLQTVKDDCGADQYVSIGCATPGRIAKLAEFVSQSISSTSSALGTGKASQPLATSQFKF
jgi:hypothetical protein